MSAPIADLVRKRRVTLGLSRRELAQRAGLSLPAIAHIEDGRRDDPRASTIAGLSRGLGIEPGDLLAGFKT